MDNTLGTPKPISFHLLEEITNSFSKDRKLGGGAYGNVYLGEYKDGEKIAVKVLKDFLDHLDDEQFEMEYHNLASLHHKNIVQLVGYCNETHREYVQYNGRNILFDKSRRVLCFNYMRNGSLDKFISDESNRYSWRTCYTIIKGICEGLEYLHEKLESPMYHLDIKPANVLLDENMSPKIADFGLSRLVGGDNTKITKSDIGTPGYIPPEYIEANVISDKFDIYSLGVVIIKIMAGRDGYFKSAEVSSKKFIELVHTNWMNRIHATSVGMYSTQVRRCIEIALSCVEADRHKRPSIGLIVNDLNKVEPRNQVLDALRSQSSSPTNQLCPCISDDTWMLNILKNELISYPLRITDTRGEAHEVTTITVGDPANATATCEEIGPRIKIVDYREGLSPAYSMDAHSTKPWILLGHDAGEVSIWNLQNQTRVMSIYDIDMHGEDPRNFSVLAAKFIKSLQGFVVGDSLGYIHVYSYEEVKKLQNFRGHADVISSLAVHPSEPFVLSASWDKLIKLWNWEADWQCIRTFKGHSNCVQQARFNPLTAGNTFASCSHDSTIKIWNMYSSTPVTSFANSEYACGLDYFSPGGTLQYLVTHSEYGESALIWDLQTNTCIKFINGLQEGGCNIAVVQGPPGRLILFTVSHDHTVSFCDSVTHRYENRVNFNLGFVKDFAFINMTKSLAVLCEEGIGIIEID